MKKLYLFILIILTMLQSLFSGNLEDINIPPGFSIEVYAEGLNKPRGLTVAPDGTIFAGSKSGFVYMIRGDRTVSIVDKGLNAPIGIDYYKGDLFVSEIDKIIIYKNILSQTLPAKFKIINKNLPDKKWHGWKYLRVGNDDKIYINIGVPCNVCKEKNKLYGTISRMNLDGSNFEIFAYGIRNSVGFDWHPESNEFWFTDNGADNFGDNIPPDELNRVSVSGEHFGFPYIHGSNFKDPDFYSKIGDLDVTPPQWELPAHVAALGMRFYTGSLFPEYYKNGIFIAEHGSWNRSSKIGYRVSFIKILDNRAVTYEVFAEGWMINEKVWGRPADIAVLNDGSIIISDDLGGKLYRIFK